MSNRKYSGISNSKNSIFKERNKSGLIVYGAGAHLQDMLSWHKDLAGCIARVVDKDESKIGELVEGLSCRVESPEVLKTLPAGTQVAISALRYYNEIVKELLALNPGLVCPDIDQVYYCRENLKKMSDYGVKTHFADLLPWCQEIKERIGKVFAKEKQGKNEEDTSRQEDIKVSVIMPLYNDEIYLTRALESVVFQTLKEIEIIIVDDCSTDHSVDIVKEFMKWDDRIRLVQQEKNAGGGAARNAGMPLARGEYLSFLDSDDYFYPTMLEDAYNRSKEMSADICVYNVKYAMGRTPVMNFNKEYIPKKDVFSVQDIPTKVFEVFNAIPWNKMFRREFVESTGIHWSETFCSNDVYFVNSHLVLAERITVLDKILVLYENRAVENSQSKYNWYFRDAMGTYIALRKTLIERGKFDDKIKSSFISRVNSALNWQFNSIDIDAKKEEYFNWLSREGFEELGFSTARFEDYLIGNSHACNQYANIQRMMEYRENEYKQYNQSLVEKAINFNYMPIVFAVNNAYAMPLSVSIISLLDNAMPSTFYDISVLVSSAFDERIKDDVKKSLAEYDNYALTFVTVDESLFDNVQIYTEHLDIETFFRLIVPRLFAYKEKVMYIDADTIICADLSELMNRNLQKKYVMGIKAAAFMSGDRFEQRKKNELDLPSMKQYINAGAIMMNLSKMRMDDMQDRFMELMKNNYHQEDQDVINKACYDNIRHLPLKYNAMIKYIDPDSPDKAKGESVYAMDELEEASTAPVIIHFANKEKPWSVFDSFWAEKWFSYAEKSSMFCPKYYPLYDAYQAFKNLRSFAQEVKVRHRHHNLPLGEGIENGSCKMTVIMPVYNEESILPKTMESLIINLQELGGAEAVIVDDCSSDSSLDILVAYAKQYPFLRIYSQDDNLGAGAALNLGLSVARGEYVAFMEATDRYYSYDSLKVLYEAAKEKKANVCAGSLWACRENGHNLMEYHLPEQGYRFMEDGPVSFREWQSCRGYQRFLYRREFLEAEGITFPNSRMYQQVRFLLQVMKKTETFYAIAQPVYVLRKHELHMQEEDMTDLLQGMYKVMAYARKEKLEELYREICLDYQDLKAYFTETLADAENPAKLLKLHIRFVQEIDEDLIESLRLDWMQYSLHGIANLYYPRFDLIELLTEKGA